MHPEPPTNLDPYMAFQSGKAVKDNVKGKRSFLNERVVHTDLSFDARLPYGLPYLTPPRPPPPDHARMVSKQEKNT